MPTLHGTGNPAYGRAYQRVQAVRKLACSQNWLPRKDGIILEWQNTSTTKSPS
jgi:hypothetical protein